MQKMRLSLSANLLVLLIAIITCGFLSSFFGVPVDPAESRLQEQRLETFYRDNPVFTNSQWENFVQNNIKGSVETGKVETSHIRLIRNSLVWRPWVILPGVIVWLLIMKPNQPILLISTLASALILLAAGLIQPTLYMVVVSLIYGLWTFFGRTGGPRAADT